MEKSEILSPYLPKLQLLWCWVEWRWWWSLRGLFRVDLRFYLLVHSGVEGMVSDSWDGGCWKTPFSLFEKINSVRCYSHTIKFTLLKCKIQWFLVLSQYCVSIIVFPEHFDHPKEKFVPIKQLLPPSFSPFSPCQPRIYFLSLFWTLHINGHRQNVAFGVFHL